MANTIKQSRSNKIINTHVTTVSPAKATKKMTRREYNREANRIYFKGICLSGAHSEYLSKNKLNAELRKLKSEDGSQNDITIIKNEISRLKMIINKKKAAYLKSIGEYSFHYLKQPAYSEKEKNFSKRTKTEMYDKKRGFCGKNAISPKKKIKKNEESISFDKHHESQKRNRAAKEKGLIKINEIYDLSSEDNSKSYLSDDDKDKTYSLNDITNSANSSISSKEESSEHVVKAATVTSVQIKIKNNLRTDNKKIDEMHVLSTNNGITVTYNKTVNPTHNSNSNNATRLQKFGLFNRVNPPTLVNANSPSIHLKVDTAKQEELSLTEDECMSGEGATTNPDMANANLANKQTNLVTELSIKNNSNEENKVTTNLLSMVNNTSSMWSTVDDLFNLDDIDLNHDYTEKEMINMNNSLKKQ